MYDVVFGQTEREAAFLNVKLHAARFRVCVGLLADCRITAAVCKQTLFQGGVVGADMDKGVFLVKPNISGYGKSLFCARRKEPPMAEQTPDSIITTQRNGQTIVAERRGGCYRKISVFSGS